MTHGTRDVTTDRIMEIGHAFRASKALLSAVELGVFTALADGPLDRAALRKRVDIHAVAPATSWMHLSRLACSSATRTGSYANSVETDLYLDRNKQTYVGGLLERFSVGEIYDTWASLTAAIQTGMPQCSRSMVGSFAPLYADERSRDLYVSAMTVRTRPVGKALASRILG